MTPCGTPSRRRQSGSGGDRLQGTARRSPASGYAPRWATMTSVTPGVFQCPAHGRRGRTSSFYWKDESPASRPRAQGADGRHASSLMAISRADSLSKKDIPAADESDKEVPPTGAGGGLRFGDFSKPFFPSRPRAQGADTSPDDAERKARHRARARPARDDFDRLSLPPPTSGATS